MLKWIRAFPTWRISTITIFMEHRSETKHDCCLCRYRRVTTDFVLLEVADALCRTSLRAKTIATINRLRQGVVKIVPLSEDLMNKGWVLYQQRPDKEWGLTDCTSFVVMQELGMTEAFTSDHHFTQAGFAILLSHRP